MDAFSYLSVLLSIILGLAITQVLQGYRALILARGRVKLAATPLLWSGIVLVSAVQSWWASFGLRDHTSWHFATFAVILVQMGLQYMTAAVVLPDPASHDEAIDLAQHHDKYRKAFFGFVIGVIVASIAKDWFLDGRLPEASNLYGQLFGMGIAGIGIAVANARVQLGLALVATLGFALYIITLFAQL